MILAAAAATAAAALAQFHHYINCTSTTHASRAVLIKHYCRPAREDRTATGFVRRGLIGEISSVRDSLLRLAGSKLTI